MSVIKSYTTGIKEATTKSKMMILLWIFNFLFASVIYFLILGLMNSAVAPHIDAAAQVNKMDFGVIFDLILNHGGALTTILSVALILFVLYFIASHLIYGGIIHSLISAHRPIEIQEKKPRFLSVFMQGAGKYFIRFFLLSISSIPLWITLFIINIMLSPLWKILTSDGANERMMVFVIIARLIFVLFLILLIKMIMDYARIKIVSEDSSKVFRSLINAMGFVFRGFGKTLVLFYLLLITGALLFFILCHLKSLIPTTSLFAVMIAFIIGQIIILIRGWTSISFQAGQLDYYSKKLD